MKRVDFVVTWLAISIVLLSILVAWAFVRWFDMVMFHVAIGAIFGMVSTIPIWLLFKVAYRDRGVVSRPTVKRWRPSVDEYADFDDSDDDDVALINCEWRVVP